jgi:hypothetical protein
VVRGGRAVKAVVRGRRPVRAVRAAARAAARRAVRNSREDCKDCCLVGTSIRRNDFPANKSSYYRRYQQDTPSLHTLDYCLSFMVRECPSKMIYTMP